MVPSTVRVLGISAEVFLIFRISFMPFHVFLILFQLAFHWIGNSGTINSKSLRHISRSVFNIQNRFYAFPCVFNAVPVGFKKMIVVVSFTLFENCRKDVSVVFIFLMIPFFYLWIFCSYAFFSKLFLIKIDF